MKKIKSNIDIRQVCALVLLFIMTVLTIYLYNNTHIKSLSLDNDAFSVINDNFHVSYNDKQILISLPTNINEKCFDAVITRHFTKDELNGDYLSFYAYNPSCDIYINNELVVHEDSSDDVLYLASPSHWYCFEVPDNDFDLTVNMHNSLKISTLFEMYSGTKSALVFNIFKRHILSIIMSLLILLAGIGLTISSLFIKGSLTGRLRWLGLTSIDSAIWVYSLSNTSQLFIDKTSVVAFLGYCSFFLLPLLVTGFILTYESFRQMLYIRILFWLEFAATTIIFLLQLFNIEQWTNWLIIVHIQVICIVVSIIIAFIKNLHNNASEDRSIYYALMIIGAFICVDIARYYISKPTDGMIKYSTYGLIVLLMYLTYSVIHMITTSSLQEAKNAIYRELAFTDTMTHLQNRSSYELKLTELRNNSHSTGCILIADLNNLKYINDTLGHQYGDEAITRTAALLRKCFDNIADCYRTGGDEFCIISDGSSEAHFKEQTDCFKNAVQEEALSVKYPFSVAIGYGSIDDRGIDECIKAVDAAMYKNKRDSKKGRTD